MIGMSNKKEFDQKPVTPSAWKSSPGESKIQVHDPKAARKVARSDHVLLWRWSSPALKEEAARRTFERSRPIRCGVRVAHAFRVLDDGCCRDVAIRAPLRFISRCQGVVGTFDASFQTRLCCMHLLRKAQQRLLLELRTPHE